MSVIASNFNMSFGRISSFTSSMGMGAQLSLSSSIGNMAAAAGLADMFGASAMEAASAPAPRFGSSTICGLSGGFFVIGPKFPFLMTYYLLFSLGEAMWQPRFLQFAAELAPKGRTGAYIAYANIPWFTVKAVAGLYTGRMMATYCPADGPMRTETMWLIYALIAMISPVGLILARRWVLKGLHTRGSKD